jgi:transposase
MFPNRSIPTPVFAAITLDDSEGSTRAGISQTNCAWSVSTTAYRIVGSVFLTNHLLLPALTICQLYKMRWQVELFFKWIKQHLRIKRFYGNSMNAVKTQVWIAVCVYVLVAILKKELQLPQSLHSILQILSVSTFEKVPLYQLLTTTLPENYETDDHNQLMLWNL